MKRLAKNFIASLLLLLASCQSAQAVPLAMRQPAVVANMGDPEYYADFSTMTYWGLNVSVGYLTGKLFAPSMFYAVNGGDTANIYYVQWKDGILRPSGGSGQSYQVRRSDYGIWIESGPNLDNNYLEYTRNLTNAAWTKSSITTTQTGITGADNTNNSATQLTATGAGGTVTQAISFTAKLDLNTVSTIVTGGALYVVNNLLTLNDSCATHGVIKVLSVSSGAVLTSSNTTAGSCASIPSNPVTVLSVSGGTQQTGTGATFNPYYRSGTPSAWIKCVTCTGSIYIGGNGGTGLVDISAQLSTSKYTQVSGSVVQLSGNTFEIEIANSGDVIDVDFAQFEDDEIATSPIYNATTSLNLRGPDNVFIGTNSTDYNAGLTMIQATQGLDEGPVSFYYAYSGNFSSLRGHCIMSSDTPLEVSGNINGTIQAINNGGGTLTSTATDTSGLLVNNGTGALNKVVVSWDGSQAMICVNGSAPVTGAAKFPTSLSGGTHDNFMSNGANGCPSYGYLKTFAAWKRAVTPQECQQYSTVFSNQ